MKTKERLGLALAILVSSVIFWSIYSSRENQMNRSQQQSFKISDDLLRLQRRAEAIKRGDPVLMKCEVCRQSVSSDAIACPHCGARR